MHCSRQVFKLNYQYVEHVLVLFPFYYIVFLLQHVLFSLEEPTRRLSLQKCRLEFQICDNCVN